MKNKVKTKSSIKKRFKLSSNGKVIGGQSNKRHNMRKRSKRQIREQRGTAALNKAENTRLLSMIPYRNKF